VKAALVAPPPPPLLISFCSFNMAWSVEVGKQDCQVLNKHVCFMEAIVGGIHKMQGLELGFRVLWRTWQIVEACSEPGPCHLLVIFWPQISAGTSLSLLSSLAGRLTGGVTDSSSTVDGLSECTKQFYICGNRPSDCL